MSIIDEVSEIERKIRVKLAEHEARHGDKLNFIVNLLNSFNSNPVYVDGFKEMFKDEFNQILAELRELAIPIEAESSFMINPPTFRGKLPIDLLSSIYLGGLDSSYRFSSDKFIYPFLYIATSYYLTGPGLDKPLTGLKPAFYFLDEVYSPGRTDLERRIQNERYIKENEYEALKTIIEVVEGGDREAIVVFDESFSPFYLAGAHESLVELHNEFLERKFNLALRKNVLPVAFYETLSQSFIKYLVKTYHCRFNGLKCSDCMDKTCLKYGIPDKLLILFFLRKTGLGGGCRTQLLEFISEPRLKAVDMGGSRIMGFYLAVDGEVVRVEFPMEILEMENWKNKIETIHLALLATVNQGSGYPYVLNKTHELARRRADEMKRRIELIISHVSGKIYPFETFTAKQLAKRRRKM